MSSSTLVRDVIYVVKSKFGNRPVLGLVYKRKTTNIKHKRLQWLYEYRIKD